MCAVNEALETFYEETQDFLHVPSGISEIDVEDTLSPNWAFTFYKNYVSKNRPLLIRNGCSHFPAVGKWNFNYFREKLSEKDVVVAVTPNGYADGIAKTTDPEESIEYFVLPEEKTMKISEFLGNLANPSKNYVCYIQRQNSNLNDFPELIEDIEGGIEWAVKSFGCEADNINFWMGDERAITSMHKDPYENIYCVIDGYKDFILISPTDLPYVPYKVYPVAKYDNITTESYNVIPEIAGDIMKSIRWVSVDPLDPQSLNSYPEFKKARKYNVRIGEGDLLYLPSLWFHHVKQSHGCIAVNFWYDMEFDIKYCYYRMLEKICKIKSASSP